MRLPATKSRPAEGRHRESSVFQRLQRSGDASAAVDEHRRRERAHGQDGRIAQKAAEVQHVALLAADGRDNAHGRRFGVHHADGGLVRDERRDDGGVRLTRDDDHVDAHAAHGRHGFQLFNG